MNRALAPFLLALLAFAVAACGPPPPPKPLPADLQPPEYEAPRGYDLGGAKPAAPEAPRAPATASPTAPATASPSAAPSPPAKKP